MNQPFSINACQTTGPACLAAHVFCWYARRCETPLPATLDQLLASEGAQLRQQGYQRPPAES